MNKLRQMSVFAHIVEEGSVSAAANKLDLSKSVVSQHLKTLEQELGITLLKRTTRRHTLTQAGEAFYQSCREINTIADIAWDQAQEMQTEPQGRLCITAPNALMDTLVTPVIADLMKQYPKLKPELISDDQHVNLMKYDIDLAIRVGQSQDSNLKQKRLGEFKDVLCGSAQLNTTDIHQLPYIANQWQGKHIKHVFTATNGETMIYETEAHCTTNSFHSCVALIKAGAGIGIIPDFYLSQINSHQENSIVPLPLNMSLSSNTIYALSPFNKSAPLAVTLCIAALEKQLAKNV
ncbi:LysR family transcriptional regulator [Photobacterium leiognathi]|uniref:LysR family transcriptional regulator n=1 Tax=Photobacterium leiognathi TaxID=553611 RepID=UPI0029825844|nr:LysR family transcriptional regulator [Photobacterium leiognathi]